MFPLERNQHYNFILWNSVANDLLPKMFRDMFPVMLSMRRGCYGLVAINYLTHWPLRDTAVIWKRIFPIIVENCSWGTRCKIDPWWMPENLPNGKSALVQVMAWWGQAASHYLSQWWPRSMSPYGVTRPQCKQTLIIVSDTIHSVESPGICMVDPQWNILYWGSKWNLHTVCWGAVGCEWGITSVYFGITFVCFIPSRLPVFAVEPQYQHRDFLSLLEISFEGHIQNL